MHIQLKNDVDISGYVKPSHLNTAQCQFATNRDTIMPTGSHNEVYGSDVKEYLELNIKLKKTSVV